MENKNYKVLQHRLEEKFPAVAEWASLSRQVDELLQDKKVQEFVELRDRKMSALYSQTGPAGEAVRAWEQLKLMEERG